MPKIRRGKRIKPSKARVKVRRHQKQMGVALDPRFKSKSLIDF